MTKRTVLWGAAALLGAGAVGAAATALHSRPDTTATGSPLPSCPDVPNCAHASRLFEAEPEQVMRAAERAVRAHNAFWTGRAVRVSTPNGGLSATFQVGPFEDDLQMATSSEPSGLTRLYARSLSRVGRGDLGVNRRRVQALLDDVQARLFAQHETDASSS